jgi:hypothetical protein
VDTPAWIEWLTGSAAADSLAWYMPEQSDWLAPTIMQLGLTNWWTREIGEDKADKLIAFTHVYLGGNISPRRQTNPVRRAADMCAKEPENPAWRRPGHLCSRIEGT